MTSFMTKEQLERFNLAEKTNDELREQLKTVVVELRNEVSNVEQRLAGKVIADSIKELRARGAYPKPEDK